MNLIKREHGTGHADIICVKTGNGKCADYCNVPKVQTKLTRNKKCLCQNYLMVKGNLECHKQAICGIM